MTTEQPTPEDCRSESGITTGLVDAIIAICRVLAPRDLSQAKEALADLGSDEDFDTVLAAARAWSSPQLLNQIEQLRRALDSSPENVERLCELMHDAYEREAIAAGWATQTASRVPWAEVPATNQATMRGAVYEMLSAITDAAS